MEIKVMFKWRRDMEECYEEYGTPEERFMENQLDYYEMEINNLNSIINKLKTCENCSQEKSSTGECEYYNRMW